MRYLMLPLLAMSTSAFALPTQLGHQGRVLDADGLPAEGPHTLLFQLYDEEESGRSVWSESHPVDLINGYYSVVLGDDEEAHPLDDDLLRSGDLFLELTVDDDVALSPRQALNAVPYARVAGTAVSLSGGVVDATELRVDGALLVDSTGTWVGRAIRLSEEEVDAYCADNGYALATDVSDLGASLSADLAALSAEMTDGDRTLSEDLAGLDESLADVAKSGSYDDLRDVPASLEDGGMGIKAEAFAESGSFTVPSGITSLMVYVTGGGGGGSNGTTTSLDLGSHEHEVSSHNHEGGSHTHAIGDHSHEGGASHVHQIGTHCTAYHTTSPGGHCTPVTTCISYAPTYSDDATGGGGSGTGSTGSVDGGSTGNTTVIMDEASVSGGSLSQAGGDGGAGGGIGAVVPVIEDSVCEIVIGAGGDAGAAGSESTITCGDALVRCAGGSTGEDGGSNGQDGECAVTGGTALIRYKPSQASPGGSGIGASIAGATSGASGAITIRF